MSQRRSKMEIIYDILLAINKKDGKIKPTHLLYKSNLSYNKMQEYIEELKKKDMIDEIEEKKSKFFLITDEGRKFLVEFKRIQEFAKSFGI